MGETSVSVALFVLGVFITLGAVGVMYIKRRSDIELKVKAFGVDVNFRATRPHPAREKDSAATEET